MWALPGPIGTPLPRIRGQSKGGHWRWSVRSRVEEHSFFAHLFHALASISLPRPTWRSFGERKGEVRRRVFSVGHFTGHAASSLNSSMFGMTIFVFQRKGSIDLLRTSATEWHSCTGRTCLLSTVSRVQAWGEHPSFHASSLPWGKPLCLVWAPDWSCVWHNLSFVLSSLEQSERNFTPGVGTRLQQL